MNKITSENTFEIAIIQSLVEAGGYTEGIASDYSPDLGMFKTEILQFLRKTQPKQWKKLSLIHTSDIENRVIQRLYTGWLFYVLCGIYQPHSPFFLLWKVV